MKDMTRCKKLMTIIVGVASYLGGQVFAYAQSESKPLAGEVTIKSNPPGALVHLDGQYRFIGRTPFVVPYPLFGRYRIHASKFGYESMTADYNFTGENKGALMMRLSLKTPTKALYRSLLFPGWGQYYSDRKALGVVFMGATAGASINLAINERRYKVAQNDYELARARYTLAGSSGTSAEQQEALQNLQGTLLALNNAKDVRNVSLYMVVGLWAFNMIESVLFFPNYAKDIEFYQKFSPELSQEGNGMKFTLRFPID